MTVSMIGHRRRYPALAALALVGGLVLVPALVEGQTVSGKGTAATVSTVASGVQRFASATLPSGGGMNHADRTAASVPNMLGANGLTSITTGQIDQTLVSATTSAEAMDVNILNGLITAKAVVALATSYANGTAATSESDGSTLLEFVVNGVSYGDATPPPNTRFNLPGVGYAVVNEQIPTGDGVHSTGLTVSMIHVYLIDALSGATTGNIVVATAQSAASR
jgi:hypothetical protein